ncbi:MAG: phosphate ABC transporter permease PstA [Candidatus Abyssobacteria bacterium SURF_17]|uniref:Phosphate transport system permease protein PstA n=1 Tax=Candidatus Abyssobacteria bacterium SURF_17 TaxID=2093361 RepID=A0A419ES61_9BACT|nr:MAG: phosphate ABC transporter permease PstA [Candidatus Abyssubacteria bacterium SURF_17]
MQPLGKEKNTYDGEHREPDKPLPQASRAHDVPTGSALAARGEPFLWGLGGALTLGISMIVGFIILILWNGLITFYPKPVCMATLKNSRIIAGEPTRSELYRVADEQMESLDPDVQDEIRANQGFASRTLYRTGNYDLYNEDFRWVSDFEVQSASMPPDIFFVERLEWGPFIGFIHSVRLRSQELKGESLELGSLYSEHLKAVRRRQDVRRIERSEIGAVNHKMEKERLALRRVALRHGEQSDAFQEAQARYQERVRALQAEYEQLHSEAESIKQNDAQYQVTLVDVSGREKTILLSDIVRFYPANALSTFQKLGVYVSRWLEFLTQEPREANTEGGVMPAIFGTFVMTVLMAIAVAPFGVMAALYLREYAKQGRLVSIIRICVNNLAGVPSIVYGVFGLGFFAYIVGASIDELFFRERLPSPTFGTGGLLWAALTLALLTVPVVIVATEEALAAVPQSMREGSLACGASKWQTIRHIVLPKAMPGIMTGLILAMARGAGEVAPLMLIGVVKLAPELPIDGFFPYLHLERSFMHLGFHIYDVGFQSRNSEAAKPMVFVTTLLLISLIAVMNAVAIYARNRLKRKYYVGHF